MTKDFFFFDDCPLRCPECGEKLMAFSTRDETLVLTCQKGECPWMVESRREMKRMPRTD